MWCTGARLTIAKVHFEFTRIGPAGEEMLNLKVEVDIVHSNQGLVDYELARKQRKMKNETNKDSKSECEAYHPKICRRAHSHRSHSASAALAVRCCLASLLRRFASRAIASTSRRESTGKYGAIRPAPRVRACYSYRVGNKTE
jgi:hypothetical protein